MEDEAHHLLDVMNMNPDQVLLHRDQLYAKLDVLHKERSELFDIGFGMYVATMVISLAFEIYAVPRENWWKFWPVMAFVFSVFKIISEYGKNICRYFENKRETSRLRGALQRAEAYARAVQHGMLPPNEMHAG